MNAIVFLNRAAYESGPPVLVPVSTEEAWNRLSFSVWAIQMPAFEERLAALEGLLAVPIYEMRYSELDPAIDLLELHYELWSEQAEYIAVPGIRAILGAQKAPRFRWPQNQRSM